MSRRVISKKLYVNLKKHYGSIKALSDRTGFSREYVREVLKGTYHNMDILEAGAQLLKELEAQRTRRLNAIQKTIDNAKRAAV